MDIRFIEELENCDWIICPHLNGPQKKFIVNIFLALLLGSGFIVVLLGCSLWPNGWWALFDLIALFCAALPDFFFNRITRRRSDSGVYSSSFTDSYSDSDKRRRCFSAFHDGWFVIAGFFAGTALFDLPLVLFHNNIIHKNTLALVISGTFLMAFSGFVEMKLVYNHFQFRFFKPGEVNEEIDVSSDDESLFNLEREDAE